MYLSWREIVIAAGALALILLVIVVTAIVQKANPRRQGNSEGGFDADGGAYNAPKKGAEGSEGDAGDAGGGDGGGGGGD